MANESTYDIDNQTHQKSKQNAWYMYKKSKKVCKTRDTSEKSKKKLQFRVGGAHIDVTTLQRNAYFFSKMKDVSTNCTTFGGGSQKVPRFGPFFVRSGVYINMV